MNFPAPPFIPFLIFSPLLIGLSACDQRETLIDPPHVEADPFSSSRTVSKEYLVACFIEHSPLFSALLAEGFESSESSDREAYLEELMTVGASRSTDFIQNAESLIETATDLEVGELKKFCSSRMSEDSTLIKRIDFQAVLAIKKS